MVLGVVLKVVFSPFEPAYHSGYLSYISGSFFFMEEFQ